MVYLSIGDPLSLRTLGRKHNYSGYCSAGFPAVVVSLTARLAKIFILQGVIFWFDLTSVNVQYLNVCATTLGACSALYVQSIVHCASPSLNFQFLMSVVHWLLFIEHPITYPFGIPLFDPCVHFREYGRC